LSTPVRLLVPRRIYDEIVAQAHAERPNECCGLLAGRVAADGTARVERRYPLVNAAQSPVEFLSDPGSMFDAERDRRARGLEFLGVYHSHPASDPVPSRKDREQSYSPEVMNLIISLKGTMPTVRAWWLEAETQREAEWQVVD
jgi:[CysO sulfur-carrier protein]-S-L-cysteine hydrolase